MRQRFFHFPTFEEKGISVVLGAILVLGVVIGLITVVYPMYVRGAIKDKEVEHSRAVGERFVELKSKIEDMGIGESRTVIIPMIREHPVLVPTGGVSGAISAYPSAFTIYGGWRQTKWSQSTSPKLESGPWTIAYENFYESENVELGENITLQAGKTSGSLTSSVCDAKTEIRWGAINWSEYVPVTVENYWVQDEPPLLIDDSPRIGENVGSYLKTWRLDNDNQRIGEADVQAVFPYVESYENYKGRVENFPGMRENNPATFATLIERKHTENARVDPILNGTFTGNADNWTYTEVDPRGFARGLYDRENGIPPGSYRFEYRDNDGAYQVHFFRADYRTVNTVTARWLRDTLTGAPPGIIDRPLIPPGQTILIDEWTTDQLGITRLPAGPWTFEYWGFRTSPDNLGSAELLVDISRRTSGGTLIDIASKVAAAPLTPTLSMVTGTYIMPEISMSTTDAIVVRVYARNPSTVSQTVYFYFSHPDWPSRMITTISVPHTDIMRITQDFTAPPGTYVENIRARFAFRSIVENLENARYRVRYLIRNLGDNLDVRVMYDSGWRWDNRLWEVHEHLIPLGVLIPNTSYKIRVEVQVQNTVKWQMPRVWVNVDNISLIFTPERHDMDIEFRVRGVTTNNYLEMRYRCDNTNDQFRVWVYDFSTARWNPRGENLNRTSWTFWTYLLGENEVQAGQVRLRIVDRDNMAILGTNLLIDFIRVRSEGVGYRLRWGHRFAGVPVTGSFRIRIYGWADPGENVGVYIWESSINRWSFIGNLPISPGWTVRVINIADYIVGNDLWIKYEDTGADDIPNEIYIDYCVLEGERPLDVEIIVEVRTGNDNDPRDNGWGSWTRIQKGRPFIGPPVRFLQYRVTMRTADPAWKPFLHEISIGVEEMGSIKFDVMNLVYPDQAWIYEGGGVILAQYDLNTMRSDPPLIAIREVAGDKIEVIVSTVTIENFPVSYTSAVPATVMITVKDIYFAVRDENCERVIVQVGSSYPSAWASYLSRLERIYNERGYNASFDNNALSLTIEGKNLTPGVNDIVYSKKVKVIEVSFG